MIDTLCVGCDTYVHVNDLGLCNVCDAKLQRDLIRSRDWDYSALAFSVPDAERENLRQRVIAEYGPTYELIAPPAKAEIQATTRKKTRTKDNNKRP